MADRYWVGGAGTWDTTATTHWSATSGGSAGASVPTAADNVIFNQAATYTVTMTGALACLNITVSAGTVTFATGTTPTLQVNGSMSLTGVTWSSTGLITFNSTTTGQTINTGGTTINAPITFDGIGGGWSLSAALTTGVTLTTTLTNGALSLNGYNLTTGIFSSTNANTRSINFGTNNIILSHTTAAQTVLSMANATNFTWTGNTQTLGSATAAFQATMSTTRTFVFGTTGGSATNSPNLYLPSGASIATITTGSWFNELNFGTTAFTLAATSLNLNQLYSGSSTSVLTALTATMRGTGYMQTNTSIGPLTINTSGTVYIGGGASVTCTTCTLTSGTFDLYTNGTLTCSSTFTFGGGSLINIGAINCTTFTVSAGTFTLYGGTITPSVSFVITGGTFTYGNGTGTMAAVPTFTHTAGTVNFYASYSLTTTGTYTFTAGTLNILPNLTLSTGIFSSANTNTRTIAFGSVSDAAYINLTHTTAATTVLSMATLTGYSQTGLGGFQVADMANTRTFSAGNTAGGSAATAPSLFFTTGASVATLTTGSWFNNLDFASTTFNPGTTSLNIAGNLTMGNGLYTTVTIAMRGSGYLWNRYNTVTQTIGPLSINTTGTINIFAGYTFNCTTFTMTAGTLDTTGLGGTITCSSTATYTGGTITLTDGAINCTTFTVNGPNWIFNAGTLTPSISFVLTSGSFTLGGTANLNDGVLPLFTHTAGTVTLNKSLALGSAGASGTYTFTAGTLTISDGYYLQCAIFSSSGAGVRTINFGTTRYTPSYYLVGTNTLPPAYISLYNSTAAQTVLNMAIATNFTYTGSGLFYCPGANTSTLVFGTTGGTTTNAPNLRLDGGSVLTVTTGSWFNVFNLINAQYTTPATSVNVVEAFELYTNGTHTALTIVPQLSSTTITTSGNTFGNLTINVASINFQLYESLLLSGVLTLTQGTLNMGTFDITSATFSSAGTLTRAIIGIGTNTYNITGSGATAFSNASGTGLTMTGFTINMNSATAKTFAGGGGSFPTLNQGGAGALTITGTNTFYNITNTVQPASVTFTAATTTTFRYFSLSGNAGNLVTITSATAANHTLSMSSGVANTQYMSISRSTATGGAGWIADQSTNGGNNSGWVFAAPNFVNIDNVTFSTSGGGITFSN